MDRNTFHHFLIVALIIALKLDGTITCSWTTMVSAYILWDIFWEFVLNAIMRGTEQLSKRKPFQYENCDRLFWDGKEMHAPFEMEESDEDM